MLRGDCCGAYPPALLTIPVMFLFTVGIQYRILQKQTEALVTNPRLHSELVLTPMLLVLLGVMVTMLSVEASP